MKKSIIYSLLILAIGVIACDPIEDRESIGGAITAADLEASATAVVIDDIITNKIVLRNSSPVLSKWYFGIGTTMSSCDTILLVTKGETAITFTGLNPNGDEITKDFTVQVDSLYFEVPPQWTYLCGEGEKKWVWDDSEGYMWGNGGYRGSTRPDWWGRTKADIEEEEGYEGWDADSYMVFSTDGATLTKSTSDGSNVEEGTFKFDMSSPIYYNGGADVWAEGLLTTTNVTILQGISQNDEKVPVYEYDIISLDDDQMILAYKTRTGWSEGAWDEWSAEAWFWVFRAAD